MLRQLCTLALLFALFLASGQPANGQEWTRFRGPNGAGFSATTNIPVEWGADDYRWKISLPGKGHGSPVIWGNRLFVNAEREDGGTCVVMCIDTRDGSTLWSRDFEASNHKKHKVNSFASSTPVVDDKHVDVSGAVPQQLTLLALDHEGNEVWWVRLCRTTVEIRRSSQPEADVVKLH
jgi:outer membrane protein assembly factor BamB